MLMAQEKDDEWLVRGTLAQLRERLASLDRSRAAVQEKLRSKANRLRSKIDAEREGMLSFLSEETSKETALILSLISAIEGALAKDTLDESIAAEYVTQADKLLQNPVVPEVVKTKPKLLSGNPQGLLVVRMTRNEAGGSSRVGQSTSRESTLLGICDDLKSALEEYDNRRIIAADRIDEGCDSLLAEIDSMCDQFNRDLESAYTAEDRRLQEFVGRIGECWGKGDMPGALALCRGAHAALVIEQRYGLAVNKKRRLQSRYSLNVVKRVWKIEDRQVSNLRVASVDRGEVSLGFDLFSKEEKKVLKEANVYDNVTFKAAVHEKGDDGKIRCTLDRETGRIAPGNLKANTAYSVKVRVLNAGRLGQWCDVAVEFATPDFEECCAWRRCPDYVYKKRRYSVDEENVRVATKFTERSPYGYCTIVGNTVLPPNKATSWSIKILKTGNEGGAIYIGVAPSDIDQNEKDNSRKCGWYLNCFAALLYSGPPHK